MSSRTKTVLLVLAAVLAILLTYWLWPRPLTATHYEVATDLTAPIRIVHLTDLHGREFGEDNADLIALVAEQQPDLIFMTGDMFSAEEADSSVICQLAAALTEIAPLYYSFGNHENERIKSGDTAWCDALDAAGATLMELAYKDISVNGQDLRIGGYYGYYGTPHMDTKDPTLQAEKVAFSAVFEQTDRQKILLSHIPTGWLDWNYIDKYDVGIVFAGHYHGGLIRIPLLDRGLYAPYVGFFPEYTRGLFVGEKSACVLSAGLSGEHGVPRIYNPPEICVVDLLPR